MKNVLKTPEFWATIIGNIIGIIIMIGGLTAEQGATLNSALKAISGGVLAILTLLGFIKAQSMRKAAVAALMIGRLHRDGGDPVTAAAEGCGLDKEAKVLLSQI
jgi:hypothetical protein